jgi:hypothetical protein
MIYGRFGDVVTLVRLGTTDDVRLFNGRAANGEDLRALENNAYVVVRYGDNKEEDLAHIAYLRADGGAAEIDAALAAVGGS